MRMNILILVPGQEGGIDRLFQNLNMGDIQHDSEMKYTLFRTHEKRGRLLLSAFLLPFRLLKFLYLLLVGQVDLCHINLSVRGSTLRKILFATICRITRTPYVIHLHGGHYREFFSDLPSPLKAIVRSFFQNAAKVIVLGGVWKEFVVKNIGISDKDVMIVPNAVIGPDVFTDIPNKEMPPHILFLGRVGDGKGVPELMKAFASQRLSSLSWSATLAGDGEVEKYKREIKQLGLDDRVAITGWVGPKEVANLLIRSSILALPSHAENLPLSMLEGMAYGLAPVVTPVGAVEDVINDGENGLLIPVGDADALAGALADLIKNPEKRNKLAHNARHTFEQGYDIKDYGEKLDKVYGAILTL